MYNTSVFWVCEFGFHVEKTHVCVYAFVGLVHPVRFRMTTLTSKIQTAPLCFLSDFSLASASNLILRNPKVHFLLGFVKTFKRKSTCFSRGQGQRFSYPSSQLGCRNAEIDISQNKSKSGFVTSIRTTYLACHPVSSSNPFRRLPATWSLATRRVCKYRNIVTTL